MLRVLCWQAQTGGGPNERSAAQSVAAPARSQAAAGDPLRASNAPSTAQNEELRLRAAGGLFARAGDLLGARNIRTPDDVPDVRLPVMHTCCAQGSAMCERLLWTIVRVGFGSPFLIVEVLDAVMLGYLLSRCTGTGKCFQARMLALTLNFRCLQALRETWERLILTYGDTTASRQGVQLPSSTSALTDPQVEIIRQSLRDRVGG
jgi:hypothetical protein